MKPLIAAFSLILVGCTTVRPTGGLVPYSAEMNELTIGYVLPSGVQFLGGPPEQNVTFPERRPYPLWGAIVVVGWLFYDDLADVRITLGAMKISAPRFGPSVASGDWERILAQQEPGWWSRSKSPHRIIKDPTGRDWLESRLLGNSRIDARTFMRPITADTLILLRVQFRDHVEEADYLQALEIQERILRAITITRRDTIPDAPQKRPNQSPEPTALLVTPRADARVAPSNAVAHL